MNIKKIYVLLITVFLLSILLFSGKIDSFGSNSIHLQTPLNMITSESTNPSSPILLSNDIKDYESYSNSTDYYYETYVMSEMDYHLVWLYSINSSDNFNLNLYSAPTYSFNDIIECSYSNSNLDLAIFRPTNSIPTYAKVESIDSGDAIVEAETALEGDFNHHYTVCQDAQEIIDIYQFNLYWGYEYTIKLSVPDDSDLDLYGYHFINGSSADIDQPDRNSSSSTLGTDEEIIISQDPFDDALWAIVIIKREGTGYGSFIVKGERTMDIPSYEFIPVLIALLIGIYISLIIFRKNPSIFKLS
ncbi:MAG: hypothetical protein GF329_01130 [Candidatus Lokiarchaeota archaeon]|nr:hypothetical protein [Candidatus Lokiarchaeota archaeon]